MSKHDTIGEQPTPEEVRETLDRMVTSHVFRGSPQIASFLRFVVEAVLHGKAERIKGYTIGVEVLRRDIKFDPQLDPIVRVEATRLRRAIERYYSGPGATEAVIIDLPRGSYVPTFRRRGELLDDPEQAAPPLFAGLTERVGPRGVIALAAAAFMVFIGAIAGLTMLGERVATGPLATGTVTARPANGMPVILLERIDSTGLAIGSGISTDAFLDKLKVAFARFDTINIISDAAGTASSRRADYRLHGFFDYHDDGSVSVGFRLLDVASGTIIWSRNFGRLPRAGDHAVAEDDIILALATTLLQPFGVIRANERARHLASGAGDPRYRCIVATSESLRSFDPADHGKARECLERLTAADPSFGLGFSYLAALYCREYLYGFGARAGDPPALDRALAAARRAIELKPESALGYQILFAVLYLRRDLPAAFAAGDKALALNRYDMTIVSDYGGRLVMAGEVTHGLALLNRAAQYGSVRPSWYNFYLFLGYYLQGDLKQATHYADQMTSDMFPLGLVARALAAAANGAPARAREALDRLLALQPGWRVDPRGELEKLFPKPEIVDRLARDLAQAGLAAPS